jgi:hypothetical protein
MKKLFVLLILPLILFPSCKLGVDTLQQGEILFPSDAAVFIEGQTIFLKAESNGKEIQWYDGSGKYLSNSLSFSLQAYTGLEEIQLWAGDRKLDGIEVSVVPRDSHSVLLVQGNELHLFFPEPSRGYTLSFGPSIVQYDIQLEPEIEAARIAQTVPRLKQEHMMRDIILPLQSLAIQPGSERSAAVNPATSYLPGDRRNFFIADIANQNGGLHFQREFECLAVSETLNLWIDVLDTDHKLVLQELAREVQEVFFPRVTSLWGEPSDVDNNRKVDILFSSLLNQSELAIGFFNPNDLFLRQDNIALPYYNPGSNEAELLYIGVPDSSDFSFSKASLLATIVHEACHLINFSTKTYAEIEKGNPDPPVLDLHVDEGLAHLTESLCGLGISGGNILFYQNYLQNPSMVSLTGRDLYGRIDTAGKRGGMAGFLSWLFWEKGGFSWTEDHQLIDLGGVEFLRNIVLYESDGWTAIGRSYGQNTALLFENWIGFLLLNPQTINRIDPYTAEILDLHPYMGVVEITPDIRIEMNGMEFPDLVSGNQRLLENSWMPWNAHGGIILENIRGEALAKMVLELDS